jgi:hypothetical protein
MLCGGGWQRDRAVPCVVSCFVTLETRDALVGLAIVPRRQNPGLYEGHTCHRAIVDGGGWWWTGGWLPSAEYNIGSEIPTRTRSVPVYFPFVNPHPSALHRCTRTYPISPFMRASARDFSSNLSSQPVVYWLITYYYLTIWSTLVPGPHLLTRTRSKPASTDG